MPELSKAVNTPYSATRFSGIELAVGFIVSSVLFCSTGTD